MISEIVALLELKDRAEKWFEHIRTDDKHQQDEQQAARLLETSGILLAALRTLDNTFREVIRELSLFDSAWTKDQRDRAINRVNQFANEEKILPIIRQYHEQLIIILPDTNSVDEVPAREMIRCTDDILWALGDSDVTPFPDTIALRNFLRSIQRAQTTEDVNRVIQQSDEVLDILDRKVIARADSAYGKLKGQILRRYPNLPDPRWSQ